MLRVLACHLSTSMSIVLSLLQIQKFLVLHSESNTYCREREPRDPRHDAIRDALTRIRVAGEHEPKSALDGPNCDGDSFELCMTVADNRAT